MEIKFEMKPPKDLLRARGLQEGGPVQKLVDSECMRYMAPYMPRRQAGELEHMMVMATVIGSGQIDIPGPYAITSMRRPVCVSQYRQRLGKKE